MDAAAALKQYKTTFGKPEVRQQSDLLGFLGKILDEPFDNYLKAYILATVGNETYHLFRPLEFPKGRQKRYFGRGYIPLVGQDAYQRAGLLVGDNLVKHPEKMLDPDVAYVIAVQGMMEGVYTGVKLRDFSEPTDTKKLVPARAVVEQESRRFMDRYIAELVDRSWIKIVLRAQGQVPVRTKKL